MRASAFAFVACISISVFVAAVSCSTAPAISVVRTSLNEQVEDVKGDNVKLKRGDQETFAGSRPGFFVVRNAEDWKRAWPDEKAPPMPAGLDTTNFMLVLAVTDTQKVVRVKVQKALETSEMLYVWVRESKVGEGCTNKSSERAFDAVVTPRADKPVRFFVDQDRDESCGDAPAAGVECRLAAVGPQQQAWSTKLTAQPGDTVECAMTATARGKFELVDKILSMSALPAGSSAKLSFNKKSSVRGEFGVDVYGLYTVNAEAADESGRRGHASATIDVKPPKTKDVLVQLVWAGFDLKDESDTFPRVNLRVAEEGPKGQRCSADIPVPGLCEVKTRGAYTYMRVPQGDRRLPISVQFLDERHEKGPGPCVHVWYDGVRTAETCDRKPRAQEEVWRVGTLDTTTGKVSEDTTPIAPMDIVDAGAPPVDAGAKKPPAKPPAKK